MNSRRTFLKTASTIASGVAATSIGCAPSGNQPNASPSEGFDRALLDPLAEVVLPSELGADGRRRAVENFVAWAAGYDPVAEEMHGYGYSDVRYLPADPTPAWRAQLAALEVLAGKMRRSSFAALDVAGRTEVLTAALGSERGQRLPPPLEARHVAVALLAHWASSPGAWNLALGAEVSPGSCRPLQATVPVAPS
jgi:hypothetical protein